MKVKEEQIKNTCIEGFLNYLSEKDSVSISGEDLSILKIDIPANKHFSKKLFEFDKDIDWFDIFSKLINNEKSKISFHAIYELYEESGLNIFVETTNAFGFLTKAENGSLEFEIDLISFKIIHT